MSNRVANLFYQHGYKKGDKVGLLMENRPEFVATWVGLSKIGIVIPLINHNLKKASLLHSINIATCNALIFGESLTDCEYKYLSKVIIKSFNFLIKFQQLERFRINCLPHYRFTNSTMTSTYQSSVTPRTSQLCSGKLPVTSQVCTPKDRIITMNFCTFTHREPLACQKLLASHILDLFILPRPSTIWAHSQKRIFTMLHCPFITLLVA